MNPTETILLIEDDPGLRMALRGFLEGLGLGVAEADDGPEGLLAVTRDAPALVLLDITLPGKDGLEVCREIRALPGAEHTPVIVMTGRIDSATKLGAFRCGAVDFVTKPLDFGEVGARLKTHLELRRQAFVLRESRDSLQKALRDADAMNHQLIDLNQKLIHAEAVKTRFLALMRNEINNPLNDIMGLADRIMDPLVPMEKGRELAALVKDEAFQLDCQIRNVFCAAELEVGEAAACVARVDVASVTRDVLASFRPAAQAKGLELNLQLELGSPSFLTDGEKLHHILANLVANAIQYSGPPGTVEVQVAGGVDRLFLKVLDQGPGIAEPQLRAIFEPFHPHGGIYKVHRGQGLGLPVVKALVDLLDGDMEVASEPGRGSRFQVSLPRAPAVDQLAADATDGNILIFDEPKAF